ncbi:UEV-domain-containing protein [Amniculicola lignicola CBS 123094]|uniref:UEV-domain-containing protein n=1 Tax=Amniculicola lignicola CBS 123094 TaxID=1392246 RepID=A0A6A5WXP7_9PLEO|nr:UEV-domain-containing protein [Amniculicola lignicola CBS 123094]
MANVPEKVLNWLYSVLPSEYADVNRSYHDIAEALSHYPSLSPRTEVYTYENGASALLLLLSGPIPVKFRGTPYGFPVSIWVPHNYPREPPLVYVTPSQDMAVRPGQHVSGDGRVYHPYLAQWEKYWDKSTIFDFLAVLRGVFAKEPPVRSKQQQQGHQYNAPARQAPPPLPPTPAEWRRSNLQDAGASSSSSPDPSSQAPAPPPKPPKPYETATPTPQAPHPPQERYQKPPPLPPHPPQHPQPPQQYQQQYQQPPRTGHGGRNDWPLQNAPPQNVPQRQSSYDMSPQTPAARQPLPQGQPQTTPIHRANTYEMGSPVSPISPGGQRPASRYQQTAPPPQPSAQYTRQQQYHQPPPTQQFPPRGYAQHPQAQPFVQKPPPPPPIDLLSDSLEVTLPSQKGNAHSIPVPPVPPNPEKDALLRALSTTLVAQINNTITSNNTAIAPLYAQQQALQTAYTRLQSELQELEQLDEVLASNESVLRGAMQEADRVMDDARRRKVPDVDEVLVAPTVVGNQLYALAAEERGIKEVLFVLGRGLDGGRVGAEVFVKQTRSLAREQFLKKALMKKIARGMGLDDFRMR